VIVMGTITGNENDGNNSNASHKVQVAANMKYNQRAVSGNVSEMKS
jgi:hypothetical protein